MGVEFSIFRVGDDPVKSFMKIDLKRIRGERKKRRGLFWR